MSTILDSGDRTSFETGAVRDMHEGKIRRMIFAGTGAMMSPTSVQQSQPIAGICHAVVLERSGA